jgi:hypothetical protein
MEIGLMQYIIDWMCGPKIGPFNSKKEARTWMRKMGYKLFEKEPDHWESDVTNGSYDEAFLMPLALPKTAEMRPYMKKKSS